MEGQHPITGMFLSGNTLGKGRVKGSRNKLNQLLLDRVAERNSEAGLSMEEIIMDIAQDPQQPAELRLKAASKILDVVHPKAASVEVTVDESSALTGEQINEKLMEMLASYSVVPNVLSEVALDPTDVPTEDDVADSNY